MANHNLITMCVLIFDLAIIVTPKVKASITCETMASSLAPCINYIEGGGAGAVPSGCCAGIQSLNSEAQSTPDRQMVCQCLKRAANIMPNVNVGMVASIPPKCGVDLPYKLDPSTDCSTIH